uniref:hypothetical protein n=1 Tax=Desulfogranum japonicum TaxID=231447 RepID=UPI0003FE2666|nr:hypothetical protein [Desulfogranum japonicum]
MLSNTLQNLLDKYVDLMPDVRAVSFDPYDECNDERMQIGHISYLIRPYTAGNEKAQLCLPEQYEETSGKFNNCTLLSIVAWDHVSWPGNDFHIGLRATDDRFKAAATNSMKIMTGVQGWYNSATSMYEPPKECFTWQKVVMKKKLNIQVRNNLCLYP